MAKMRKWMPIAMALGAPWCAGVFTYIGATSSSPSMTWYAGLGLGLVAGPPLVLVGEGVLRAADIALRREHGLLAYLSPTFLLRAMLTLVPGVIARSVATEGARPTHDVDDCAFAGRVLAQGSVVVGPSQFFAGDEVFRINREGTVLTPGGQWGTVDAAGALLAFDGDHEGQIGADNQVFVNGEAVGILQRG